MPLETRKVLPQGKSTAIAENVLPRVEIADLRRIVVSDARPVVDEPRGVSPEVDASR